MPSAGGICPPLIVALKGSNTGNKPTASKFSNNIDIDTYIEISTGEYQLSINISKTDL